MQRLSRSDWLNAVLVSLGLLVLYAFTAPRTVVLEDDGLFVLSSYYLGIEHPPGYPLHTLLGKLFTLLPVGSVAYRVHLLSAVLGALTCGGLWLCVRALVGDRVAAYVAAAGLGVSRTFWSQAIIAEVYTFNTLFLVALLYLCLRAAPPEASGQSVQDNPRLLRTIAFVFGLSLANHWPLMLLAAPGLAVLMLPRWREMLRHAPSLLGLFALGLVPYVWMVVLSWGGLVISFDGPLESLYEVWFFISRSGYAHVDHSPTADWVDRIKYFQFFSTELLAQFAFVGTALAAAGFAVQWRVWGRRVSLGLTLAFLGPSALLILLLGFDYDSLYRHMFHVYPLPSYAIAALWMGLGVAWLMRRYALRPWPGAAAASALIALIFATGIRQNLLTHYDWAERYARAILETIPKDAILIARGDPDLAPLGYFHLVEGWRPDITLVQPQGIILGNRLFHPLRTSLQTQGKLLGEMISSAKRPVVLTQWSVSGFAQRDRWLYRELDTSSRDPEGYVVDIPEELVKFFEEFVLPQNEPNGWAAFIQGEMRRQYGRAIGLTLPKDRLPPQRTAHHVNLLSNDYFGALGVVEGMLASKHGYSLAQAVRLLEHAARLMPSDARKSMKARFFELRAYLRLAQNDERGATADLETSISLWPMKDNGAAAALADLYTKAGRADAKKAMLARIKS